MSRFVFWFPVPPFMSDFSIPSSQNELCSLEPNSKSVDDCVLSTADLSDYLRRIWRSCSLIFFATDQFVTPMYAEENRSHLVFFERLNHFARDVFYVTVCDSLRLPSSLPLYWISVYKFIRTANYGGHQGFLSGFILLESRERTDSPLWWPVRWPSSTSSSGFLMV